MWSGGLKGEDLAAIRRRRRCGAALAPAHALDAHAALGVEHAPHFLGAAKAHACADGNRRGAPLGVARALRDPLLDEPHVLVAEVRRAVEGHARARHAADAAHELARARIAGND